MFCFLVCITSHKETRKSAVYHVKQRWLGGGGQGGSLRQTTRGGEVGEEPEVGLGAPPWGTCGN